MWKNLPTTKLRSTLQPGAHREVLVGARRAQPGLAAISLRDLIGLRRGLVEIEATLSGDRTVGTDETSN